MAELGVADDTTELHDSPEVLQQKVDQLAGLVKASGKIVIHTGAGISTSAGIPDFRGPEGVWTLRAKGLQAKWRPGSYSPTLTHMMIVGMLESGRLYHLVSQNTGGLHIRSGIPTDKISELHGNTNMEQCSKCGHWFIRSFRTRTATKVHDHLTGRKCERCDGALKDTIINFGESLPRDQLGKAYEVSQEADLAIVLGTSLRVSPANDLPLTTASRGKPLVIVNLQGTPLDPICNLRIFAKTDEVMAMLAERLGMEIPPPRDVTAASGHNSQSSHRHSEAAANKNVDLGHNLVITQKRGPKSQFDTNSRDGDSPRGQEHITEQTLQILEHWQLLRGAWMLEKKRNQNAEKTWCQRAE